MLDFDKAMSNFDITVRGASASKWVVTVSMVMRELGENPKGCESWLLKMVVG